MIAYIPINLKEFDLTLTFREFVDHIYGGRADFELVWKDFDALVAMLKTARKDRYYITMCVEVRSTL